MGNIWVLFKNNLKMDIIKKPTSFIVMLFAPLVILFLSMKLLMNGSGYINLAVFDNDNSKTSQEIVELLEDNSSIKVMKIKESEIDKSFASNTISGVVKINKGYEEDLLKGEENKIAIISKEDDSLDSLLKSIIGEKVSSLKGFAKVAGGEKEKYYDIVNEYKENKGMQINKKSLTDLHKDYNLSQIFVGFVIFFMLLRGANSAYRYYEEQSSNVFSRIFTSPIKPWQYYVADILSNYFGILIQAIFAVIFIKVLNVNIGISSLSLFLILSIVGLFSVVLAVFVRAFSKEQGAYSMAFNFISMILIMLGGGFISMDMLPETMNKIAYFNPVRWSIDAMLAMQQGASSIEVVKKITVVFLFIIALLVISIYKTTKDDKSFA